MEKYLLEITQLSDTVDCSIPSHNKDNFTSVDLSHPNENIHLVEPFPKTTSTLGKKKEFSIKSKTFSYITTCCDQKCCLLFSAEHQERLFHEFYQLADYRKQISFLIDNISVTHVSRHYTAKSIKKRQNTRRYQLPGKDDKKLSVCKAFFKAILHVSDGCIDRLLKQHLINQPTTTGNIPEITDKSLEEIKNIVAELPVYQSYLQEIQTLDVKTISTSLLYSDYKEIAQNLVSKEIFEDIIFDLLTKTSQDLQETTNLHENESGKNLQETDNVDNKREETITFYTSQRNLRKINKTLGLPYVNSQGKQINGKTFAAVTNCCKQKCFSRFPVKYQTELFRKFYLLGSYNNQNAFIFNHVQVVPVARHYKSEDLRQRNNSRKFNIPDQHSTLCSVCKHFFRTLLQISDGRINRVLHGSEPPLDRRGFHAPGNKTSQEKIEEVIQAIHRYSCDDIVNKGKRCTVRDMYKLYCEDCVEPVSEFVFRSIFNGKKTDNKE